MSFHFHPFCWDLIFFGGVCLFHFSLWDYNERFFSYGYKSLILLMLFLLLLKDAFPILATFDFYKDKDQEAQE